MALNPLNRLCRKILLIIDDYTNNWTNPVYIQTQYLRNGVNIVVHSENMFAVTQENWKEYKNYVP